MKNFINWAKKSFNGDRVSVAVESADSRHTRSIAILSESERRLQREHLERNGIKQINRFNR